MGFAWIVTKSAANVLATGARTRLGRHRGWPPQALVIDEPLALAEAETSRLRRIYANASRDLWDGPALLRAALQKHGGIQLERDKRVALCHLMTMLMWGELAAWIVSAELAERLEDPDARLAASSQVFDEARHFYTLRDYVALLHVPVAPLDPYFATAARSLLDDRDLNVKLVAMQLLAEGTAQAIFSFLGDAKVEPVLCEILPYVERDEARHVGLGILHLPERLAKLSPRECRRLSRKVLTIGDLFAATQVRFIQHYRTLELDPRRLFRRADTLLCGLAKKLGNVPGTDEPYFRTNDPTAPGYDGALNFILPPPGREPSPLRRAFGRVLDFGAKVMPS
jgi:hypothetical protein